MKVSVPTWSNCPFCGQAKCKPHFIRVHESRHGITYADYERRPVLARVRAAIRRK